MSNDFSLGEVHVSSSPQERFEEYLQSRGKRITQQRRALVDYIFARQVEAFCGPGDGSFVARIRGTPDTARLRKDEL